jgi:hypothetical protein
MEDDDDISQPMTEAFMDRERLRDHPNDESYNSEANKLHHYDPCVIWNVPDETDGEE